MDRRGFLTGLIGVAGAAAFAGVLAQPAGAAPLARTFGAQPQPRAPEPQAAEAGEVRARTMQTPDGTPVEEAQSWRRRGRRGRRRRSRLVCRTHRVRGRLVRRCSRVWGWF